MSHNHHLHLVPKHFHHQKKTLNPLRASVFLFSFFGWTLAGRGPCLMSHSQEMEWAGCRCWEERLDKFPWMSLSQASPFGYPQVPLPTAFKGEHVHAPAGLLFYGRGEERLRPEKQRPSGRSNGGPSTLSHAVGNGDTGATLRPNSLSPSCQLCDLEQDSFPSTVFPFLWSGDNESTHLTESWGEVSYPWIVCAQ